MVKITSNLHNRTYFPYVLNVHKLYEFICLNDQIEEILACPHCKMPEWTKSPTINDLYKCRLCDQFTMKHYMKSYTREEYLDLLENIPLKYDGKMWENVTEAKNNNWTRTYAQLNTEETAYLDTFLE
jgi:hypothetical protein